MPTVLPPFITQHECIDCRAEVAESGDTKRAPRKCVDRPGPKRCVTHTRAFDLRQRKQARARSIERTYGISAEEAHELLLFQGGRCWLCQKATGAAKSLAVDHDHQTEEVRGRLCGPCNQFIGRLGDDPAAAQRLVAYLTGDTPYRRLKAFQALSSVYGEPVVVHRTWTDRRSQRLTAEWGRMSMGARRAELVPVRNGETWSCDPTPVVTDSEPRVETPGECPSCHALPDQPHTEYCKANQPPIPAIMRHFPGG